MCYKMKNITFLFIWVVSIPIMFSCNGPKRDRDRVYMPDMAYSRSYQTYIEHDFLKKDGIFYNNRPVAGTFARGEEEPFPVPKNYQIDSDFILRGIVKDSVTGKKFVLSNPFDTLMGDQLEEAHRLYLVYCGICHGDKLDGNGPLYNGGNGPFPLKPASLVGDITYEKLSPASMFFTATYGKNFMGSYASQLSRLQRWEVIYYIKKQQNEALAKGGK